MGFGFERDLAFCAFSPCPRKGRQFQCYFIFCILFILELFALILHDGQFFLWFRSFFLLSLFCCAKEATWDEIFHQENLLNALLREFLLSLKAIRATLKSSLGHFFSSFVFRHFTKAKINIKNHQKFLIAFSLLCCFPLMFDFSRKEFSL